MKTTFPGSVILSGLVFAATLVSSVAAPVRYSWDDTGSINLVGAGSFTIDIGDVLGEYVATDVAGSGALFGAWTSVVYRAVVGEYPVVRFFNVVGGGAGFQAGSLGGDRILPGSEADLEWEHLLNEWRRAGVRMEVQSAAVPEASTWVAGASVALAGLLAARRRG